MKIFLILVSVALVAGTRQVLDEMEFPHSDTDEENVATEVVTQPERPSDNVLLIDCRICRRRIFESNVTTSFSKQNTIVHSSCYMRSGLPQREPSTPRILRGLRRVASLTCIDI